MVRVKLRVRGVVVRKSFFAFYWSFLELYVEKLIYHVFNATSFKKNIFLND